MIEGKVEAVRWEGAGAGDGLTQLEGKSMLYLVDFVRIFFQGPQRL